MFKLIYCIIVKVTCALLLGFAANETFREKNAKIFVCIPLVFSRNLAFFHENEWSENTKTKGNFAKKKFQENLPFHENVSAKFFWWIFAKKKFHYFLNSEFFREIFTFLNARKFLIFSRLIFSWLIDLLISKLPCLLVFQAHS